MPDAVKLVKLIKQTATDAVEATKPVNICFGTVTSENPLQINVEQKMTLGENQLILSRNVTERTIEVTNQSEVESADIVHKHKIFVTDDDDSQYNETEETSVPHTHNVKTKSSLCIENGLVKGDKVILVSVQGGQKYIVWDKIV